MKRIATAVLLLLFAQFSDAGVTQRWLVDSYSDWDEGEGEGSLITSNGELRPGWVNKRTALEFDATWAMVRAADSSILVGSDDEGAIFRVSAGKATKIVTIKDAIAVVALAVGSDGSVFAGTMPGGTIWRVDIAGRKATKLATLDDVETIWALAIGKKNGLLYAGTGPNGKLFEVDPRTGAHKQVFDTEDKRVQALAATADGAIWLGTSEEAIVFRHDPAKGTTRAIADFSGNEITALAAYHGGVIAAANDFAEPTTTGVKTEAAASKGTAKEKKSGKGEEPDEPKKDSKPGAEAAEPTSATVPRKGKRKGKGALYRVDGDGRLEQLHVLTTTYFASVAVHDDKIFGGAGDKGRIYVVDAKNAVSTAFDVKERIVAQIIADDSGLLFATADGAALYTATGAASKASYASKVLDAKTSARFGNLVWRSAGSVKVDTRTGNTSEPGVGWSKWQPVAKPHRRGGEAWGAQVTSPPGRYLQFRIRFDGDADAVVRAATVYHLPANRPTKLSSISLKAKESKGPPTLQRGAAKPRSPVIEVSWKVDNPDKDTTYYRLEVRMEGEVRWRALPTGDEPVTKPKYEWNTETFPDGYYRLRITASDKGANPASLALQTHRITPLFLVDNNKPELTGTTIRGSKVSTRAVDSMSNIAEASFSVDDGPWQLISTDDGLFDNPSELLLFGLPKQLTPGPHTLAIRVADEAGNIGSSSMSFR